MGEKAKLQAERDAALSKIKEVGDEIDALTTAKNNLESYNTEIPYKLVDNGTIANTYHLDGTKYEKMTTDEQKLLTDLTILFNNKRDPVITSLTSKIESLVIKRGELENLITSLDFSIAYAKN